jgi:hypothetical protein
MGNSVDELCTNGCYHVRIGSWYVNRSGYPVTIPQIGGAYFQGLHFKKGVQHSLTIDMTSASYLHTQMWTIYIHATVQYNSLKSDPPPPPPGNETLVKI